MIRVNLAAIIALVAANTFATGNPYSPAGCSGTVVPINGVVSSTPASSTDPGAAAGCLDAAVLGGLSPDPLVNPPVCLRIDVSGTVKASGYSMLTQVPIFSAGGVATTPFCFFVPPPAGPGGDATRGCSAVVGGSPVPSTSAGLQGFTSQAALTGRVNGNRYQGTVYTKDTGYITADGFVGQILLIVGGTGDFNGATGRVGVAGQEVGDYATYTGHVCIAGH